MRRPKLAITGGGGGGGAGSYHRNHISVSNQPGLLGIRLGDTVVFGRRLHGRFEKGLTVDRSPASECQANLHDRKTGQYIAGLWWTPTQGGAPWQRTLAIGSGGTVTLALFARLDSEPTKFFVFEPENPNQWDSPPREPIDDVKFHDTHEFPVADQLLPWPAKADLRRDGSQRLRCQAYARIQQRRVVVLGLRSRGSRRPRGPGLARAKCLACKGSVRELPIAYLDHYDEG